MFSCIQTICSISRTRQHLTTEYSCKVFHSNWIWNNEKSFAVVGWALWKSFCAIPNFSFYFYIKNSYTHLTAEGTTINWTRFVQPENVAHVLSLYWYWLAASLLVAVSVYFFSLLSFCCCFFSQSPKHSQPNMWMYLVFTSALMSQTHACGRFTTKTIDHLFAMETELINVRTQRHTLTL